MDFTNPSNALSPLSPLNPANDEPVRQTQHIVQYVSDPGQLDLVYKVGVCAVLVFGAVILTLWFFRRG